MKLSAVLAAGLLVQAAARSDYTAEALKDEIKGLPGAPKIDWRTFSGYIDVSAPGEAAGTRQMFYWFVESQKKAESDPVMLWTNGGPGCTGLGGFMSEQGPFRPNNKGTLDLNPNAWSKLVNMVFIEQPVGVGFSTTSKDLKYGDAQAAADNHRFVTGFFKRFSNYKKQEFYISSESYGGHYMPTLAKALKDDTDIYPVQFRGVFLGNPLTYMPYRNYGQYGTAYGHQLLPEPLWKKYEAAKCRTTFPPSEACNKITGEMDRILSGFDAYALDFETCTTSSAAGRHERWVMQKAIQKANAEARGEVQNFDTPGYDPCEMDYVSKYLNRPDVRKAIHVKTDAKWAMCSDKVGNAYNVTDVNKNMVPLWKELIGSMNIMIVSGDDDSVCATLGTQQFIWDYAPAKTNWQPWQVNKQTAGFLTEFDVKATNAACQVYDCGFRFATVHSAGHMIPSTQPVRSLELLRSYLAGRSEEKAVVV